MLSAIRDVVENTPAKIAYQVKDERITFGELWELANIYADLLIRQGTSPVIIYGHKEIYVIVTILACIIAKRTYVPIDIGMPLPRVERCAAESKAGLIITERNINIDNVLSCDLNYLKNFKDNPKNLINNDTAYIIFTSGSSGEPKGVAISYDNLNNFISWICSLKPLKDYKDINVLNQACFSFDLSVADLYYSLVNGHTLIALEDADNYEEIFKTLADVNVAVMTPTFIKLCLLDPLFNRDNYHKLKCVYFCGEQLEVKTVIKLFRAFPDLNVINAYGPSEATSAVSAVNITKDMLRSKLLPVGDMGNLASDIQIIDGEIVIKGKSVFRGYLGNIAGGHYKENNVDCYRTGDIGYIEDNRLYCVGRGDRQIKYKGYRIELDDIEYHINQIPYVKECCVIAKYSDDCIVKAIKAFVVLEKDAKADGIKDELAKKIPRYMIPKTIEVLDRLPVNQNGKIDRKALS